MSNLTRMILLKKQYLLCFLSFLFFVGVHSPLVQAESLGEGASQDELDAYDPFSDYSEFENPENEQKDIEFFQSGRFLTLGGIGGWRYLTEELLRYQKPNFTYGVFVGYFINLDVALQFTYLRSLHNYTISHVDLESNFVAKVTYHAISFDFKYYFDRQKLIKLFSFFNPHIFVSPLVSVRSALRIDEDGNVISANTLGYGVRVGVGLEIKISENMYLAVQGDFSYIEFEDENKEIIIGGVSTGYFLRGDIGNVLVIIGVNF